MTITVLPNQSLLDISILYTGSVFNAFVIAVANGISVSETIKTGDTLIIPETVDKDKQNLTYYERRNLLPGTAIKNLSAIEVKRGIGWMKVGSTFKVD